MDSFHAAGITQARAETSQNITRLLTAIGEGDHAAFDQLMPLVYSELHQIARRQMRRLWPGQTLDTTGLVHEAYIRLIDQKQASWHDRDHFFSIVACSMRQILVNYAVHKQTEKRGGGQAPVEFDEMKMSVSVPEPETRLLELDAALKRLEELDSRLPRVVECRFFAGLTQEETARALGVTERTVRRDWQRARAWLQEELDVASPRVNDAERPGRDDGV